MIVDEPVRTRVLSCICMGCRETYTIKLYSCAPEYLCRPATKVSAWGTDSTIRRYIQEFVELTEGKWLSKGYATDSFCENCAKKLYHEPIESIKQQIKKEVDKNDN